MQLVFFGEVLAGFTLEDVKRNLGQLLKLDEARQTLLFSGKRTVLKRALEPHEAQRYAGHLGKMGARIHIEPCEHSAAAPVLAVVPVAEEIVCPNCCERQSKRILCRSCSSNMEMGIAAKLEAEQEARTARMAEARARRGLRPIDEGVATTGEAASMWGLGFSGRMGRLPYATAGAWLLTVMYLMLLFMLQRPSVGRAVGAGIGLLAILFVSMRLSVLRCHDCNRSGWWTLLMLVPYLGFIVGLVVTFMPGTREDNDYGERPPSGSWLFFALSLVVMCASVGFTLRMVISLAERAGEAQETSEHVLPEGELAALLPSAEAIAGFRNQYAPAPSHKAFAVSSSGAWGWKSGEPSMEAAMEGAVANCDANRKPYTQACELVNVDGQWGRVQGQ